MPVLLKKKRKALVGLFLALGLAPLWFLGLLPWPKPKLGPALKPDAVIAQPDVAEASGLVQSERDPELFWLHNDSGDVARIFACTLDGEVVGPPAGILIQDAHNQDWEDLTRIGERLFLADLGNNFNRRRNLGVYEVPEPDPRSVSTARATAFYPVAYQDQQSFPPGDRWDYDCEAVFAWADKLYFITKTRPAYRVWVQGQSAQLYRLDTMSTTETNLLTRVDEADGLGGWVTAADTTRDGRYLAVLIESPVQSVWLFERPARGDRFFSEAGSVRRFVFHEGGQLESLAFFHHPETGRDEIIMLNEEREIFRLSMDDFQSVQEENRPSVQTPGP